jgi:hypothetical protein
MASINGAKQMGVRTITLAGGVSPKAIPKDVRIKGVLFNQERQPWKLTEERKLRTRAPIDGEVTIEFEKIVPMTVVEIDVAAYWPLTPTK